MGVQGAGYAGKAVLVQMSQDIRGLDKVAACPSVKALLMSVDGYMRVCGWAAKLHGMGACGLEQMSKDIHSMGAGWTGMEELYRYVQRRRCMQH